MKITLPKRLLLPLLALSMLLGGESQGQAKERLYRAALESIRTDELQAYVELLADDSYEGRASGTRGGHAAATYITKRLKEMGLQGGGADGGFFQHFSGNRRNLLAIYPGSDPELKNETILIGAHYDHVGYGSRETSFGPIGYIHNGADDNASGVAALLELAEALATHKLQTKRSILIAFWDGEELGMLGSKHWARQPTVPLSSIRLAVNIDMVGRLREGRLELIGSRTGYGLRRLASVATDENLWVDFSWMLEPNSDHWTFIERQIPTLMLHTGLHDDYHRPSDDVEKLNTDGIRLVSRYLLDLTTTAAMSESLPKFRNRGISETPQLRTVRERALPPLADTAPRPRVGISWREDEAEPGLIYLTRVIAGTPAKAAGLQLLDRVESLNGQPFRNSAAFEQALVASLTEDAPELRLVVERRGIRQPVILKLRRGS